MVILIFCKRNSIHLEVTEKCVGWDRESYLVTALRAPLIWHFILVTNAAVYITSLSWESSFPLMIFPIRSLICWNSLMYMIIWCSKEYPVEMSRLFSMVEYSKSEMNQIFDKEQMFHVFTSVWSESIACILRKILLFKKLNTSTSMRMIYIHWHV